MASAAMYDLLIDGAPSHGHGERQRSHRFLCSTEDIVQEFKVTTANLCPRSLETRKATVTSIV